MPHFLKCCVFILHHLLLCSWTYCESTSSLFIIIQINNFVVQLKSTQVLPQFLLACFHFVLGLDELFAEVVGHRVLSAICLVVFAAIYFELFCVVYYFGFDFFFQVQGLLDLPALVVEFDNLGSVFQVEFSLFFPCCARSLKLFSSHFLSVFFFKVFFFFVGWFHRFIESAFYQT